MGLRTILAAALLLALPGPGTPAAAQGHVFKYRLYFKDKKHSPYSTGRPLEFLSAKAVARREKWGLKTDRHDLPVSPAYVAKVAAEGVEVLCLSKWNNTALVQTPDSAKAAALAALPFVAEVRKVYDSVLIPSEPDDSARLSEIRDTTQYAPGHYGYAQTQIEQLHGTALHDLGFRGWGMTIAVIDGGFRNADTLRLLDNVRVLGTHNFVRPRRSVYAENQHGTNVLSCMGANKPGTMVGTAPAASYWLLVSEDTWSETPAEQDTWAAALEFADSVGADVVNSSLGYNTYDDKTMSVSYAELDGKTQLISRSASLAASRGLMVVNSAGNSGDDRWKLIGVPADASGILTVGAVDAEGKNTVFSSLGPAADGRMKPDVVALGLHAAVVRADGRVGKANGTSFSSPVTAGMVACLMQALPELSPEEVIRLLHESADRHSRPDNVFGYGIPDYFKAYKKARK